jgi:spore maturation protein CgeB
MKFAAVLMKYDYGDETRGYSYEYINIFLPLVDILGESNVVNFDFYADFLRNGKEKMNKNMLDFFISEKTDAAIFCLFQNEMDEGTLDSVRKKTKTLVYFFDDPWRQRFARNWIKYFDYFSTPDYYMYRKYLSEGLNNVIYSPFGFNSGIYKKLNLEKIYDVSFVGGYSPYRKWIIDKLKKEGIEVKVFGRGWKTDAWISQDEMVRIFNQTRINLNLSNSISFDMAFLFHSVRSLRAIKEILLLRKSKEQIKGRHYEINACGGFQLSYFVPGLNLAYEIDKEIAVYEEPRNIAGEINFFLKNDDLRNEIAERGYVKSIKEHTAQGYLTNLIEQIMRKDI